MHRAFSYNDVAETFESSFSYKKKISSSFLLLLQRIVRYWEQNKLDDTPRFAAVIRCIKILNILHTSYHIPVGKYVLHLFQNIRCFRFVKQKYLDTF
jgi:hypothetical protein